MFKTILALIIIIWGLWSFTTLEKEVPKITHEIFENIKDTLTEQQEFLQNELDVAIENNYTFYIDGEEINPDYIDIWQYEFSVNHEKESVHIKNAE